jgi:hypothetical protein
MSEINDKFYVFQTILSDELLLKSNDQHENAFVNYENDERLLNHRLISLVNECT